MPLRTSTHCLSTPSLRVGSDGCATLGGVPAGAGAIIVSNRLASIIKFASVLTTNSRNGANRRVPVIGASAIWISRPSERYLTSGIFARWPGYWFVAYGTHNHGSRVPLFGCHLIHAIECELQIIALVPIEDR